MADSLAALKLFSVQLRAGKPATSLPHPAVSLFGMLFQRTWLQGVLVSGCDEGRFLLYYGTDVVEIALSPELQPQDWKTGMYVMVVGLYTATAAGGLPLIKVHKMADLSGYPDREAMCQFEVIETHKLFYLPSHE